MRLRRVVRGISRVCIYIYMYMDVVSLAYIGFKRFSASGLTAGDSGVGGFGVASGFKV